MALTGRERLILVDFLHMAHLYFDSPNIARLSYNGVETTISAYTIKRLYHMTKGGHYLGVALEGGSPFRKEYFKEQADGTDTQGSGYKGNRKGLNPLFRKSLNTAVGLMEQAKVTTYRKDGFEADDMIYSVIQQLKSVNKENPIDVFTNDADLLPLVDEQVSVYVRGTRTYSTEGSPMSDKYFQVTPKTWSLFMGSSSAFKGYYIPYNSLLLFKMLRGDTSDNISAVIVKNKAGKVLKFGKKTYSELVEKMEADGVDFANTFRYVAITADNRSDEEYRAEVGAYFDKTIKPVLAGYFEEEAIQGMRYNYIGMNLRAVSADLQCLTQIPLETLNPTYLKYGIHIR